MHSFVAVAELRTWDNEEKLQQILPRSQGPAANFAFGQMKETSLKSYKELNKELKSLFREIKPRKSYRRKFNYMRQSGYVKDILF